jgi:hypothetical protein
VNGRARIYIIALSWALALSQTTLAQPVPSATAPVTDAPAQPASPTPDQTAAPAPTVPPTEPAPQPAPSTAPSAGIAASFAQYGYPGEVAAPPDRPTTASVPEPAELPRREQTRFGDPGQFALLVGSRLGISSSSYTNSEAGTFDVALEPAIEYFIVRNVSVGVELDVSHSHSRGYDSFGLIDVDDTLIGAGLHFGLNVPLSRRFSVYPLFMVGFHHIEQKWSGTPLSGIPPSPADRPFTVTRLGPWIQGELPLLFHPVEHFFVGIGPSIYQDFSRADAGRHYHKQHTDIGADFVLGGYFDFRNPHENVDDAPSEPRPPYKGPCKFGDAGTVVLTEESGLSWHAASYSGIDPYTTVSLSGAFDWFFTSRQSLGFGAFYSATSDSVTFYGDKQTTHALGLSVRYGFLVPFYSWFSVYPRMSLQFSMQDGQYDQATTHSNIVTASIFVPALAHLAPHFFVGLGPSVSEDIVHTEQQGPDVKRTGYGVGSIIGGWL